MGKTTSGGGEMEGFVLIASKISSPYTKQFAGSDRAALFQMR